MKWSLTNILICAVLALFVIWLCIVIFGRGDNDNDGRHGNDWEIHPTGSVV